MPTPREQLANLLRQSRLDAGYESHGALAKRLNVSRPVVSKAENPAQPVPSDAVLAAWAGATGAALDTLTDLAQRARSGTPDWFMPYRQAEAEASILRCWSPVLVPGLLQTESYMRAVMSVEPYTAERLDELVAARLERQAVIGCAYLTAVFDQHVLYRLIGSAPAMAEQCCPPGGHRGASQYRVARGTRRRERRVVGRIRSGNTGPFDYGVPDDLGGHPKHGARPGRQGDGGV